MDDCNIKCHLCDGRATWECDFSRDVHRITCERCGVFDVSHEAEGPLEQCKDRHLLSGLTRNHWLRGQRLLIRSDNIEDLKRLAPDDRNVSEKTKRLLLALERMTQFPGKRLTCVESRDYPLAFCRNPEEFDFYLRHLGGRGFTANVSIEKNTWQGHISAEGWGAIDGYGKPNAESDKVFVAMWFAEEMDLPYLQGIQPAIEEDCGYRSVRIDMKEFEGDVVDEILAEIRESRFIVADMTGQRPGVYYEAGFALGLGLPVVRSCRKDEIKNVHFDARQQNHMLWESAEELRERLANRIRAVIGLGPHKRG